MLRAWCNWGVALGLLWGSPAGAAVTPGDPAPDFTLLDIGGREYSLAEFSGKVVLLALVGYG